MFELGTHLVDRIHFPQSSLTRGLDIGFGVTNVVTAKAFIGFPLCAVTPKLSGFGLRSQAPTDHQGWSQPCEHPLHGSICTMLRGPNFSEGMPKTEAG